MSVCGGNDQGSLILIVSVCTALVMMDCRSLPLCWNSQNTHTRPLSAAALYPFGSSKEEQPVHMSLAKA
jgi:hypothetical protein